MDRLVYVAMTGAKEILAAQAANNANLANASTVGFRADLTAFRTEEVTGAGLPSRAYATDDSVGYDTSSGVLQTTGRALDVSVRGEGWIAVQAPDGTEAYTRAGDLHVDPNGLLMSAAGNPVMGDSGPITLPPHSAISVGVDGSVSVVPQGQPATSETTVARIKLVNPAPGALTRGADGLFRTTDASSVPADASVKLAPGTLESSNVNIAETMATMIELARAYELQVKAMKSAEDNAATSSKLLAAS
jgi:flagellar basal-body rod protein FlgF